MDYKNTLNLPDTDFPMKANLPQREPEILARWQGLYEKLQAAHADRALFILHDGPPYANGDIHLGHAVNKILKDMILKSKMLSGFRTPFIPGWDCHGLPIELQVEKNLGKALAETDNPSFRAACRAYAAAQIARQKEDFQRLGILGAWEAPYKTMEAQTEAGIVRSLAKIAARGHLKRGQKPVHWCTDCGSALAEAEVEYQEKTSTAIDVGFRVLEAPWQAIFPEATDLPKDIQVVIWTTTPWTLPANQAVALHPDFRYQLWQVSEDKGLILAAALAESCLQRYGLSGKLRGEVSGKALEHLQLAHPFLERQVPIILGEHVTADTGSGAVHTAPGHGQEDYDIGLRYGLPVENPVDDRGVFYADVPFFGGLPVRKAETKVLEVLRERGQLLADIRFQHSYPHCWRHKTPLIFRATSQWFISMEQKNLRQDALAAVKKVQWFPAWGQERIEKMLENRPDWCISRQRRWGVPLAIWVNRDGEMVDKQAEIFEQVAAFIEKNTLDAFQETKAEDLGIRLPAESTRLKDTLDVWFDSGVTHETVLAQRLRKPADLYLEGSDQHRGWFQSSLLTAVAMDGAPPFKQVLTHGFTVDAQGRKMSKSLGNVIAPQQVIDQLGADILRLWVASTDYSGEMTVSDDILKRTADIYRRIRNTLRFLLANLKGFTPQEQQLPLSALLPFDRYVLQLTKALQQELLQDYEKYQFHLVVHKIQHFCSVTLGGFYLDIIKDRQYTCKTGSLAHRSCQTALYHIAESMLAWLAPILSFTAEEALTFLPQSSAPESVFFKTWYQGLAALPEDAANKTFWENLLPLRDVVNQELEKARKNKIIGGNLEAEVTVFAGEHWQEAVEALGEELRFFLLVSETCHLPWSALPAEATTVAPGLAVQVNACQAPKCSRCWQKRWDVGTYAEHPEICGRCVENVVGSGEKRLFV
jgi:isoleucyl-tRNA synthetase